MIWPNISPELYAKLLNYQATSYTVEKSFSMLGNLVAKDRHIPPKNVWKYLALYINKLNYRVNYHCLQCLHINATFIENKCNFLTFLLCTNATFVENKCNFLTFLLQQKLALVMTERVLSHVQVASMGFSKKIHGVALLQPLSVV